MKLLRPFFISMILFWSITSVTYSQAWNSGSSKLYANPTSTKIGIGTTAPRSPLHVQGSKRGPTNIEYRSIIYAYNTSNENSYKNPIGLLGVVNGANGMAVYGKNSSGWAGYFVGKGYFSERVGIGTTSPQELLHLNGSIRGNQSGALRISSGNGYIDVGAKNAGFAHFYTDRPRFFFSKTIIVNGAIGSYRSNLSLQAASSTKMTITTEGNVGIGTSSPGSKLEVAGMIRSTSGGIQLPDGTIIDEASDLGGGSGGDSYWDAATGGINYSEGNVGINNSTPSSALDVNGDLNFTGQLLQNGMPVDFGGAGGNEVNITNVALGKPVTGNASSLSSATDGDLSTYASTPNTIDLEIIIDLGSNYYIGKMDGPDIELTYMGSTVYLYVSSDGINFEKSKRIGSEGNVGYFEVNDWVKKIKVVIDPYNEPPPNRVYELIAWGSTQIKYEYFTRLGIGTTDLSEALNVNGNAIIKNITTRNLNVNDRIVCNNIITALSFRGKNDSRYFLSPNNESTSLKVQGNIISEGKIEAEEIEIKEIVSNTIITNELKTNSLNVKVENVADYVFSEDYSLKSLEDVECFVKEHKHLPEVPSAEILERDGMNIAEMNNLLLKKIEELTLYLIELKKDNKEMREILNVLNN